MCCVARVTSPRLMLHIKVTPVAADIPRNIPRLLRIPSHRLPNVYHGIHRHTAIPHGVQGFHGIPLTSLVIPRYSTDFPRYPTLSTDSHRLPTVLHVSHSIPPNYHSIPRCSPVMATVSRRFPRHSTGLPRHPTESPP